MKDPIRIKLTPQEADIIRELFSNGDTILIAELLEQLPSSERHRLADKIRTEMEHGEVNTITVRAFVDGHSRLHIQEVEAE